MGSFFTSKQITTIIVAVAVIFVVLGVLTVLIELSDDNESEIKELKEELAKQDGENGTGYKFDIKSEGVDDEEPAAADEVKVKEPLERDPYEELDELIGLQSVKEEVRSLANYVKVQKQREEKGLKNPKLSYHLVFTGSPGTGKTTVARIVARIYKDLGILKKGHLVETDRSGLIGQYVGQTAPRVNQMCDSALNGVLFIDEAYALTQGGKQDYGDEAVATLLKRMEDDRDRLVVIVAGYTDEMKDFINTNPGLQSRFNRYINFPDYSSAELYDIFLMYLRKNQYNISSEGSAYLKRQLERAVENKDRNFGNARYVRNIFEKAIQCQANRLASSKGNSAEDLTLIKLEDLKAAF
jgi:SpoVK/Ycf46/Vps4 family AAA+-type ATPase